MVTLLPKHASDYFEAILEVQWEALIAQRKHAFFLTRIDAQRQKVFTQIMETLIGMHMEDLYIWCCDEPQKYGIKVMKFYTKLKYFSEEICMSYTSSKNHILICKKSEE